MTDPLEDLISEPERKAVREAVARAEADTSGEIVVCVAARCGTDSVALWRSAALGVLVAVLTAVWFHTRLAPWGNPYPLWLLLPAPLGLMLGLGLAWALPPWRRLLCGTEYLRHRVLARAAEVFVAEEVFATRDRTGILIFLALFERRVEILADTGIHRAVPTEAWAEVAAELARGARRRQLGPALVEAVQHCGQLLAEAGLEPGPSDRNELDDVLRLDRGRRPSHD